MPDEDAIGRLLAEIDAESPLAIQPQPDGVRLFFQLAGPRNRAAEIIASIDPPPACRSVEVSDEDWAARSQASLGAVIVDRVVVRPPWARRAAGTDAIEVIVLPSMGFGTGHHASTRLCLRLLQRAQVTGARVLDAGTGSAVLAIAAAKLGAASILAVDSDPDALAAASENVDLNGLGGRIEVRSLDLGAIARSPGGSFDIVLANLTGALLARHAETLRHLVADDGVAILSGFERDEADSLRRTFAAVGLPATDRDDEDGWVGFVVRASPTRSTAR
jgi:ribosomal protein L11 methyltransferase